MSITTRQQLINQLQTLTTFTPEEKIFAGQFLELLSAPQCYSREHLPGHITGSAWIVNKPKDKVLLVHHAKLNRWLQPGGHADGNENVFEVALREATEETGLTNLTLLYDGLFDLDIHPIPERKDFPEHLHYDIRFAFQADDRLPLTVSSESYQVAWVHLKDTALFTKGNVSIQRMAEKTTQLA